MMENRRQTVEAGVVCAFFLVLAGYVEASNQKLDEENRIVRGRPGEGSTTVELELDAGGILEDYSYELEVEELPFTRAEADQLFEDTKREIDACFYADGDTAEHVTHAVSMREAYADRLVRAEWTLKNYNVVNADGTIREDALSEEGTLVEATAELSCGEYRQSYHFGFMVYPREKSPVEELLQHIEDAVRTEQDREGGDGYLTLPDEVDGYALSWTQAKEHLVIKILLFEVVVIVLLYFVKQERKKESEKLRKEEMLLDYAELVNKLLILLGSGMSLKQAWNQISARYLDKREKGENIRHIYEEMVVTNYEIQDGESERTAYQRFGERTGLGTYYRFVRILAQNLQTGSRGLCQLLEQEAESALEERKTAARKLGEEAGTKMLLPLMMMLGIVIAIIMVPAILSFHM